MKGLRSLHPVHPCPLLLPLLSHGEGACVSHFLSVVCHCFVQTMEMSLVLMMYKGTRANAAVSIVLCFRDVFLSHVLTIFVILKADVLLL